MQDIKFCKHVKKQHRSEQKRVVREAALELTKKRRDEGKRKIEAQIAAKLAAITTTPTPL